MEVVEKARLVLQKIYTISKKKEQPRLFIQNLPCESAKFKPGEQLFVHVDKGNKEITIQNKNFSHDSFMVHVSSRKNKTNGEERPLIDTARDCYTSIIAIEDKVELRVYVYDDYSKIVVSPLHYDIRKTETIYTPRDQRFKLLSLAAGAGIGTSHFVDTGAFSSMQEIEVETDSAENLKYNFPNSLVTQADIRDCNLVVKSDVALVTLPCNNHTSLGDRNQDMFDNISSAAAKILVASEPEIIFFENVPGYYKSRAYTDLQDLLKPNYPYWIGPIHLESHDFGSIAKRDRGYAVAFSSQEAMYNFKIPTPPEKIKRKKLKDYLDPISTLFEWKSVEAWNESFNSKVEKNNSWANRSTSLTFLDGNTNLMQCIPKRYRSHSASNSYVLSNDKKSWRFLTVSELRKIFLIPDWFEFVTSTPIWRVYEQIGQSACGRVFRIFANEIARVLMKSILTPNRTKGVPEQVLTMDQSGQLSLM